MLALHRMRRQLVRLRVMQVDPLRGLLFRFGVLLPQVRRWAVAAAKAAMAAPEDRLSATNRNLARLTVSLASHR